LRYPWRYSEVSIFLKPETVTCTGLDVLRRELIPPRLVTCLGIDEFCGGKNGTVNAHVTAA